MLYGRNRDSVDATLIRDTLQTLFYFYDEYATTYGNVSVNTVERTNTRYIDYDAIVEARRRNRRAAAALRTGLCRGNGRRARRADAYRRGSSPCWASCRPSRRTKGTGR